MATVNVPKSNPKMPFGKHRGQYVTELPDGYLCWLMETIFDDLEGDSLREAIYDEYQNRGLAGSGFAYEEDEDED